MSPVQRIDIFGVSVDAMSMEQVLTLVTSHPGGSRCHYICAVSAHGVVEAQRSPELREAYQSSFLNIPDGMPLAWIGRALGIRSMPRVTGPDLMQEVFVQEEIPLRHFLYGGQRGVAEELANNIAARYPSNAVVGLATPPFRELGPEEEEVLLEAIRALRPDVVWIGLGCPKQELFMAKMADRMPARFMIGVGAAFDFHTGRIRDCSPLVKALGLQWLHRLSQDPRRLWRRYLRVNATFLWMLLTAFLRSPGISLKPSVVCTDSPEGRIVVHTSVPAKTMR